MKRLLFGTLLIIFGGLNYVSAQDIYTPTLDSTPKKHSPSKKFVLSKDYPKQPVHNGAYPWQNINFKDTSQSEKYLRTVLAYFLKDNATSNDFRLPPNQNKWFHAPSMFWQNRNTEDPKRPPYPNGREFFQGLTRERNSDAGEIYPKLNRSFQNWAVGFYNNVGAYTIEKAWELGKPSVQSNISFNPNTVAAKLLFTEATPAEVPYLQNTLKWTANIHKGISDNRKRKPTDMYLLQLDLAIKDSYSPTGWVFGTFVYHKNTNAQSKAWYDHLLCVGVAWGGDEKSQFITQNFREIKAAFNKNDTRTWRLGMIADEPATKDKLLNGPVDDYKSSCLQCHAKAKTGSHTLDYSLQLDFGIKWWKSAQKQSGKLNPINSNHHPWTTWTLIGIASCFSFVLMGLKINRK
ncbi:MAG: hypothetical protein EAZ70_07655 [Runella slithyformis]|nr:MAG: hypothetical protein EAY79_07000 [Runella slithyformis]TAF27209.1 MAG: hypothetical protein EAZ70_07655 [Runella slithyformis]TAF80684.1 MAG: hypothetical protein EAZ50_08275 [Runella slithyformis]